MVVSIIIVNWNGWQNTIECLESVLRLSYSSFRVIVCDNASTDGSFDKIKSWAMGRLAAESANSALAHLTSPPLPKPVPDLELTRVEAESGGVPCDAQLILVQNGENLGFAAGNNVGLRYALRDPDCRFFWFLNNDTVVDPHALSALVRFMQQRPEVGICGSLNLSYFYPEEVQAQGGMKYNRWTGRVHNPAREARNEVSLAPSAVDYINGASMMVSRAFVEQVGPMDESYFLYFEELDWAERAKGRFALGYTRESAIYHKVGAVLGSNSDRSRRSILSDMYLSRNRLLFTRRFFPGALPSVFVCVLLAATHRLCRGDWKRAAMMLTWSMKGLFYRRTRA
jgi:GT2 family glycosyltransferase